MNNIPVPAVPAPRVNTTPHLIILTDTLRADLRSVLEMLARRNALKALQAAPGSRHAAAHQLATTILLPQNLNPNCDAFALANALCDLSVAHVNRPNPDTLETIYRSTLSARRLPAMGLNGLSQVRPLRIVGPGQADFGLNFLLEQVTITSG